MTLSWIKDCPNLTTVETAWERKMMVDGLELYEASRSEQDTSDTGAGKAVIRKLIRRATTAIEAAQKTVLATRTNRERKAALIAVPAETLALITLTTLLNHMYAPEEPFLGTNRRSSARRVGESVEFELSFRTWIKDSKEAAKAYAKDNSLPKVPVSSAERLIKETGATSSNKSAIRRAVQKMSEYKWTNEERLIVGDALVEAVIAEFPEYFSTSYEEAIGSRKKYDCMLPALSEMMDRTEIARGANATKKRPMLTPPRKWTASVL